MGRRCLFRNRPKRTTSTGSIAASSVFRVPQGLNQVDWFVLDRDHYHVPATYAVARGWRYIGTRPQGFTHGGLTPEETIVPLLVCRLGESEFERLEPLYQPLASRCAPVARANWPCKSLTRIICPSNEWKLHCPTLALSFPRWTSPRRALPRLSACRSKSRPRLASRAIRFRSRDGDIPCRCAATHPTGRVADQGSPADAGRR